MRSGTGFGAATSRRLRREAKVQPLPLVEAERLSPPPRIDAEGGQRVGLSAREPGDDWSELLAAELEHLLHETEESGQVWHLHPGLGPHLEHDQRRLDARRRQE